MVLMAIISVVYLRVLCFISILMFTTSSLVAPTTKEITYSQVMKDVVHHWTFDMSPLSLYRIRDTKTTTSASIGEGGARLTKVGNRKDNNVLSLEGLNSRLELGRFDGCLADISKCSSGLTISLWLRIRNQINKMQYVVGNSIPNRTEQGISLCRTGNGMMNISILLEKELLYMVYRADSDTWYHHVVTWDGKSNINVTVNGRQLIETAIDVSRMRKSIVDSLYTKNHAHVGKLRRRKRATAASPLLTLGRSGYSIDADYDDVAIWNRVLNANESLAIYKGSLKAPVLNKSCRANASSICVTWKLLDDPYEQVHWIKVMYSGNNRNHWKHVKKNQSKLCIRGLDALSTYRVSILIYPRNLKHLQSKAIECYTTNGVPDPPVNLTVKDDLTTLLVQWKKPKPANGRIIHYSVILRRTSDLKIVTSANLTISRAQARYNRYNMQLTNLTPDTQYKVSVACVSSEGASKEKSFIVSTFTKAPTSPVTDAEARVLDWNKVEVTWKALDGYNNAKMNYKITLRNDKDDVYARNILIVSDTHVIINNLRQLSSYFVNIQAGNAAGYGPKISQDLFVRTPDHNECLDPFANLCDIRATCHNLEGSYVCECYPGYVGSGTICKAIPIDAQESQFCRPQLYRNIYWARTFLGGIAVGHCPGGTMGFATRSCAYNPERHRSTFNPPDLSNCVSREIARLSDVVNDPDSSASGVAKDLKDLTSTEYPLYGGDVRKIVEVFEGIMEKKDVQEVSKTIIGIASNLLNNSVLSGWNDIPEGKRSTAAIQLLDTLENLAVKISDSLGNTKQRNISTSNVDLTIHKVVKLRPGATVSYIKEPPYTPRQLTNVTHDVNTLLPISISLPIGELFEDQDKSQKHKEQSVSVAFFSYKNIDKILVGNMDKRHVILNSGVVSATILGKEKINFKSPVVLMLPHLIKEQASNASCVFWNTTSASSGRWQNTGCYVNYSDTKHTICHCYHLTNFAVLMSITEVPEYTEKTTHHLVLRIITYIGILISIIALIIAFLTFWFFRFMQGPRNMYHKHLVAALILANFLFLVGIERTENAMACTVIAIFLHYFFLVSFVWMGMEGILLYFMLKKIFSNRNFLKRKRCAFLCWSLPALYVAVLASIKTEHYGNSNFCWLSKKDGFVWTFVGPVLVVLMSNFCVMFNAFKVMKGKHTKQPADDSANEVWYWLKGCLVLTCILGVTWLFGLFYLDRDSVTLAYIFTVLNAFQGLFIFVFHCFIDSRVRREYVRILRCQPRYKYNEKAGYDSSMRYRKWSSSIKSTGSLDRSLSHSLGRRTKSDPSDKSRHGSDSNGDVSKYLLKTTPAIEREMLKRKGSNDSDKIRANGYIPELTNLKECNEGDNHHLLVPNGHCPDVKETDRLLCKQDTSSHSSKTSEGTDGSNSVFGDTFPKTHELDRYGHGIANTPKIDAPNAVDEVDDSPDDEVDQISEDIPHDTSDDEIHENNENPLEDSSIENLQQIPVPSIEKPPDVEETFFEEFNVDRPYSLHIGQLDTLDNLENKNNENKNKSDIGPKRLNSLDEDEGVNMEVNIPMSMKFGHNGLVINIGQINNEDNSEQDSAFHDGNSSESSPIIIASSPTDRPISMFEAEVSFEFEDSDDDAN